MTMFKTHTLKDTKRSPSLKRTPISRKRLFQFDYDECPLPYFEIIPSKLLTNQRYVRLSRQDQGDYLRLIMLIWLDRCRYVRCSAANALKMGMEVYDWERLEKCLLDEGLLEITPDGLHVIQPSLREQYLLNRQSNLNKKRSKYSTESADAIASASAT